MSENQGLRQGTLLHNRYKICSVLGHGGFGITYHALDILLNRHVAVKEFFVDQWMERSRAGSLCTKARLTADEKEKLKKCRQSFLREAKIMETLRDIPYLSRIQESFSENNTEYIVMKLLEGESLGACTKRAGAISSDELLPMMEKILYAIELMHEKGIIHRDICPNNLILTKEGVLYLIDFGSATSCDNASDLFNEQVFGNQVFEAPEHLTFSEQGAWTDIYSVCATIIYLLTKEGIPNSGERKKNDPVPQMLMKTGLTAKQQNVLLKGLNIDYRHRYLSAHKLRTDLCGKYASLSGEWEVLYAVRTDIGGRSINQDNLTVDGLFYYSGSDFEKSGRLVCGYDEIHLAAICDGVGGAQLGELASQAAIQALMHFAEQYGTCAKLPERLFDELLDQMNEKVISLGHKIGTAATTLSALFWKGNHYWSVNIGDSPIYLLRKRKMSRLSIPHTKAWEGIEAGKPVAPADFHTLTKYLGKDKTAGSQMAEIRRGHLQKGDIFLICSDGVTEQMDEIRLRNCILKGRGEDVHMIWKVFARRENRDNGSVILLKF